MVRRMTLHAFAVAVVSLVSTFGATHAEPTSTPLTDEVVQAANEANVDPVDLKAALDSQNLDDPRAYLVAVGELAPLVPPLLGAVSRADCIIGKESGGLDIYNKQGSGASGPGQYFPGTWQSHVALYRRATGYVGSLSLHVLSDVERVMAWILWALPGTRTAWTVSGC
jgi:hypothetical protein